MVTCLWLTFCPGACLGLSTIEVPPELWNEVPIWALQTLQFSEPPFLPLHQPLPHLPPRTGPHLPQDQPGTVHSPHFRNSTDPQEGPEENYYWEASFQGEAGGKIIGPRGCRQESECLMWYEDAGAQWLFLETLQDRTRSEVVRLAVVECPWQKATGQESFFPTQEWEPTSLRKQKIRQDKALLIIIDTTSWTS